MAKEGPEGATLVSFNHPRPTPDLGARHDKSVHIRIAAAMASRGPVYTEDNGECDAYENAWPTNFSKGLPHDLYGIPERVAMQIFVDAIAKPDTVFDVPVGPKSAIEAHRPNGYKEGASSLKTFFSSSVSVRAWESPISGHAYDLQGPDAGSVGMAPAPRLGSDELAAEMAEVYGMALLRDMSFEDIRKEKGNAGKVCAALNAMPWFDRRAPVEDVGGGPISEFSERRRAARFSDHASGLSGETLFRGSTPGSAKGPYISQFMLQGNTDLRGTCKPEHGQIVFGAQRVDQRVESQKKGVDYMTSWEDWLDVQNGANLKGQDVFETALRFVTTPRDLATYVHFDALYQAYLNACLILLRRQHAQDRGLPEPNGAKGSKPATTRDAFATFGGPHILNLVTETATRSLKAVRRQKYNFHLRARPEALGGVASLSANGLGSKLGLAQGAASKHLEKLLAAEAEEFSIMGEIARCNGATGASYHGDDIEIGTNYLLPMAFPEGSPMHPAYGAGHATVAGSCTTMLKAFFEMYQKDEPWEELTLANLEMDVLVPTQDGLTLCRSEHDVPGDLTLQGELDKVAANISIGRNMAGVHYYSDYYDSLRMGERIAVGILMEQAMTYGEPISMRFHSFDGDKLEIYHGGAPHSAAELRVDNDTTEAEKWFTRHVPPLASH